MIGMKPKDNELRMKLGFKTTHHQEYFLFCINDDGRWLDPIQQLAEFAEAIRAEEREACAKLCEEENWSYAMGNIIRNRGE